MIWKYNVLRREDVLSCFSNYMRSKWATAQEVQPLKKDLGKQIGLEIVAALFEQLTSSESLNDCTSILGQKAWERRLFALTGDNAAGTVIRSGTVSRVSSCLERLQCLHIHCRFHSPSAPPLLWGMIWSISTSPRRSFRPHLTQVYQPWLPGLLPK